MPMKFPKSAGKGKANHSFARTLVKRHKVVPYLEKCLENEIEGFEFKYETKLKDDAWHPSGHCVPSPSDLFKYATVDHLVERKIDSGMQKIFAVGHFWHQLLQWAAIKMEIAQPDAIECRGLFGWGELCRPRPVPSTISCEYQPWHWSTGAGDIAPCVTSDWTGVVDFKTMSSSQFRSPGIPDWAAGKYEAQINLYMEYFSFDSGIIVAVNKDTPHAMREFEFERNQNLIDVIKAKWEYVSYCLDDSVPPDPAQDEEWDLEPFYKGPVAQ